jgi:general secretion pathway protein D
MDLKARREAVVQGLIAAADTQRGADKLDAAEQSYRRVLAIEPGNNRASRGIEGVEADRRHAQLVEGAGSDLDAGNVDQAEAKVRAVLSEDPGFGPANALRARIDQARGPVTVVPRLRSRDSRPVTLQFRDANTKMVFEVLSRQTGINFIFDKDVKGDGKTTIFVQEVPVEQAIDLVLGQNQLARQVLSENMVMIYPNTPAKQREYQDQIVKTFYLTNADPKQAQNLLKTVLDAKTLFIDERANEIIIRDTPEMVRMAEKLLGSLDLPEPEVMMEVEVLEITRSRLQQLGIAYPSAVSLTANPVSGSKLTLNDVRNQNSDTITVSSLAVTLDALKQVGVTNVLASPRIRARNHQEARILIGSRVPVITNSVTPTAGGTAVVTGSVQYVDVGLTLEVEPTVYLDNDVAIKVKLEVSSIIKEINNTASGTLAYQIGTRNANTLLRLKDGETQILAGLIQDQDSRTSSHIPGLGDLPGIGRLFGSKRSSNDKTEIVLSITPRIIRSQPRPSSEVTEFWYGTESSVRSAPMGTTNTSAAPAPNGSAERAAGGPVELSVPSRAEGAAPGTGSFPPAPATSRYSSAPATGNPPTSPTMTEAASAPRTRNAPSTGGAPAIAWDAPGQVGVGQDFEVRLRIEGGSALKSLRSQVRFDPAVLQLASAEAGDVVPSDIRSVTVPRINQIAGILQFTANAPAGSPLAGEGELLVLHFKALTPNPATKVSLQLAAAGADGANYPPAQQAPLTIVVTP